MPSPAAIRALANPPYRITGSFAFLQAMDVPRWFGLRRGRVALRLPTLPDAALEGEATIGSAGHQVTTAIVSLDFLTSTPGRDYMRQYLDELPRFLAEHRITIGRSLLIDTLSWSLSVLFTDQSAPDGVRILEAFEVLGLEQLQCTVHALRTAQRTVLYDEATDDEVPYLAMGNYMALDASSVTLRFTDASDDDAEDPVQTQVTVSRASFADAMATTHSHLQELVDGVCTALGVRYRDVIAAGLRT